MMHPDAALEPLGDSLDLRQIPVFLREPLERTRDERRDVRGFRGRVEVERAEGLREGIDLFLGEEEEGSGHEVPGTEPGDQGAPLCCVGSWSVVGGRRERGGVGLCSGERLLLALVLQASTSAAAAAAASAASASTSPSSSTASSPRRTERLGVLVGAGSGGEGPFVSTS